MSRSKPGTVAGGVERHRPVNESEQARLKETNAELQTRLQELATQLDSLRESNLKVARSQDGLLKRIQISHEIGGAVPWLIFAMLFIIETGPIFFKTMIVKGAMTTSTRTLSILNSHALASRSTLRCT